MGHRPRTTTPLAVALAAAAALTAPALAAAAPGVQITGAGPGVGGLEDAGQLASGLLAPGVALEGPATINGGASYAAALPSFGRFTNGVGDLGLTDGLVVTANARASSFAGGTTEPAISTDRDDLELFDVVNAAGLCARGNAADCTNNATSLEFAVRPTARYLKFEYVLAVTETGAHDGTAWSGNVFSYPDGFALFVGGRQVADNCAVLPHTTSYTTMQNAGVVAPAGSGNNRAAAQANLDARIADPAAPAGFAYAAQTTGWNVRFLTVPLTCVADVDAALQAGTPVGVKIVVADANDSSIPPAVFLKGGSVRFSGNGTPSGAVDPPAPSPPVAPPSATAPDSPAPSPGAPGTTPAPAARIVTPLGPATVRRPARGRGRGTVRLVQRLTLEAAGRYTFIHVNRQTGRRLTMRPGSTVGRRTLPRRATAPVIRTTRPGTRVVLATRFASRGFPKRLRDVGLRVVLLAPDGSLSQVRMRADGRLG